MEKEDLISIIIPVYKVEKYLDKCVQSVVNQSYHNIEVILVDDGSPDSCPQICDEWAKKDKRIKVVHKQNGGLSDARNVGIDKAKGNFLMFIDSDDYVHVDICKQLKILIDDYNCDFAMCGLQKVYEDSQEQIYSVNQKVQVFKDKAVLNEFLTAKIPFLVTAWAKLYKRELFKDIRYPVGKLHEDEYVIHKLLNLTNSFVYTNQPMYYYLQRNASIMSQYSEKNALHVYDAIIERYNFFDNESSRLTKQENLSLLEMGLRSIFCKIAKTKYAIKKEVWDKYKEVYSNLKNKSKKAWLFRRFRFVYLILLKLKNKN